MNYPKISIVTPSFNQGKYIEQTIRSVINQNYPNLEYIIIDGGSTDETVGIIKKYEEHLTWWISEPDNGQTDAINKGFSKCTGDIFNWINSDDYYEPGALLKLGTLFLNNPSVEVICANEWYFDDASPTDKILHKGSIIKKDLNQTIRQGIIVQPCTFFRTKAIRHFFPLDTGLRYVMDRQLWWSYLLQYGQQHILQTDDIVNNFRLHSFSKSVSEANNFELEFDRLKLSLFRSLNAPAILIEQLGKNTEAPGIAWQYINQPPTRILAPFAAYFAERKYIKDDLDDCGKLMKLVKQWKHGQMNKREWQLWIYSNLMPPGILMLLKRIKKGVLFS